MTAQDPQKLFSDIYDATKDKVLRYVTAKCADTNDIQDIMQEIYLEIYRVVARRKNGYIQCTSAFVMKIAKQKLYRHYRLRDRIREMVTGSKSSDDNREAELFDEVSDICIEDTIVTRDLLEHIAAELKSRPPDVQKVFYLYYGMGLTVPEIAKELSISQSNVKHKLYRTLNELRKIYSKGWKES